MKIHSSWRADPITLPPEQLVLPESAGAVPESEPPRPLLSRYSTPIAFVLDFLAICAGSAAAFLVHNLLGGAHVHHQALKLFAFSCQYAIAFILFGRIHFLYSYNHSLLRIRDTAGILRVSTFCFILLAFESFFSRIDVPRLLLIVSWVFITLFVLLEKHATRPIIARWKFNHIHERQVLILGAGSEARRIFSFLLNSPDQQLKPVAFFEEQTSSDPRVVYSHDYQFSNFATVHTGKLSAGLLKNLKVSDIFVADATLSPQRIAEITALSLENGIQLSFVASVQPASSTSPVNFRVMDGLFVSSFSRQSHTGPGYELAKRLIDVAGSTCILVASLPLSLAAAVWIKTTSEGPVFFKQERIGRNGVPFKMFKFRSMYITAPKYGRSPEESFDPRITPAGRFLRKTSLDEVPQILNVLLGQMSLVGPRPEMPYVVAEYSPYQKQRLDVQQGLTGMWQLSADRKFAIHQSIEYDLYYIENRGIFLDLAILLHTAAFAMKGI